MLLSIQTWMSVQMRSQDCAVSTLSALTRPGRIRAAVSVVS